jgi:hypothetical protein
MGEEVLRQLSLHHLHEIKTTGPTLARALTTAIASAERSESDENPKELNADQRRVKS